MIATESTRLRGREIAAERNRRRREDLSIAVDLLMRSVPDIDALVAALDGAGALRAELARRRGGAR